MEFRQYLESLPSLIAVGAACLPFTCGSPIFCTRDTSLPANILPCILSSPTCAGFTLRACTSYLLLYASFFGSHHVETCKYIWPLQKPGDDRPIC